MVLMPGSKTEKKHLGCEVSLPNGFSLHYAC